MGGVAFCLFIFVVWALCSGNRLCPSTQV